MATAPKPWKAEYAKSSRASCRACSSPISKDTFRLARMRPATQFDGFMPVCVSSVCLSVCLSVQNPPRGTHRFQFKKLGVSGAGPFLCDMYLCDGCDGLRGLFCYSFL
jgi:hypothetical protein